MHHRTRSIAFATVASLALIAGSLLVGLALRPDSAEASITLQAKVNEPQPAVEVIDLDGEPAPETKVITVTETVIISKRQPVMRPGTTVRDPRSVPAMGCSGWKDSLVGGQYRVCEVEQ